LLLAIVMRTPKTLVLLAALVLPVTADAARLRGLASVPRPDVFAWNRHGTWEVDVAPLSDGSLWSPGLIFFEQPARSLVTGGYVGLVGRGELDLLAEDRDGMVLSGRIADPELGEGSIKLVMLETLDQFVGKVSFKGAGKKLKGRIRALYRPSPDDASNVEVRVQFANKKSREGFQPRDVGTLAVFLINHGPQPVPYQTGVLNVVLALDGFFPADPEILRIAQIENRELLKGLDLAHEPYRGGISIRVAVKDVLVLGIRFRLPDANQIAGSRFLRAYAAFNDVATNGVRAEVPFGGIVLRMLLRNRDDNPIHIFQLPSADPFSAATRVDPGQTRVLRLNVQAGQQLRFGCGRQGTTFDTCEGTALKAGTGRVTYDPKSNPPFLALVCGG
jgi:hypothetical protein